MDYQGKRILVTGGTGMIGRSLIDELVRRGANKIYVASLDDNVTDLPKEAMHIKIDLTDFAKCLTLTDGINYVFHLAGIKGSPKMCKEQPASFMVPTIMFNTNMIEAARRNNVERFVYTSSVGVYSPAPLLKEDDVWKTFPSENDKFAGWAKRMGELQIEAYRAQYGLINYRIVRPTNIYGPYDNFDPANAMVIPSLIARVAAGESPLKVWGDGTQTRDFLYTDDCARGIVDVFESDEWEPVNLGSGTGYTIRDIVGKIIKYSDWKPEVVWDTSKPSGDKIRVLDTTRAKSLGINPVVSLDEGIKKTVEWFKRHGKKPSGRYNVFAQGLGCEDSSS